MTGTIKTLRTDKGFGFIKDMSSGTEYFFHHTGVQGTTMEELSEGDTVQFELGAGGPKGPRAEQVRRA
jgi:cold shock CspA family protein